MAGGPIKIAFAVFTQWAPNRTVSKRFFEKIQCFCYVSRNKIAVSAAEQQRSRNKMAVSAAEQQGSRNKMAVSAAE